jgi:regulatory protein
LQQRTRRTRPFPSKPAAPPSGDALSRAVDLLSRRAHSRWELRRKLRMRGFEADAVDAAMARLGELGYLNDSTFAKGLVRRRAALRGPRALSAELAARGVDRAEADAAVAEFDLEAQIVSATRLAERLHARRPDAGYREMLDTIGTKLLRRGFPVPVVKAACRSVLAGAAQPPED